MTQLRKNVLVLHVTWTGEDKMIKKGRRSLI